jgi:hypothetical protein
MMNCIHQLEQFVDAVASNRLAILAIVHNKLCHSLKDLLCQSETIVTETPLPAPMTNSGQKSARFVPF